MKVGPARQPTYLLEMSNYLHFHPIQPQICRRFGIVSITINDYNGNVVAFIVPSTPAFAMVFAVDFVAASINFKNV